MVRGMALRSMCALRVENLVEYVHVPTRCPLRLYRHYPTSRPRYVARCERRSEACRPPTMTIALAQRLSSERHISFSRRYVLQPLQDGLRDKSPYVRKTAVMGCVKLFYTSATVIHECNIPDTLYAMLKDPDSLVVANCVVALEEILASEGGIVLTREIAHRLLNGLQAFNEWCQCIVMSILIRYVPSNEDEVFDILNILELRLKHANSGVVLVSPNRDHVAERMGGGFK